MLAKMYLLVVIVVARSVIIIYLNDLHIFSCAIVFFNVSDMVLYQYFIEVVPTDVSTFLTRTKTYQYSVKDHMRLIDHHRGECVARVAPDVCSETGGRT